MVGGVALSGAVLVGATVGGTVAGTVGGTVVVVVVVVVVVTDKLMAMKRSASARRVARSARWRDRR